jgi:transcriptional regulator with XRE-family HTH domain
MTPAVAELEELREKAAQIEGLVTPPDSVEQPVADLGQLASPGERRRAWHRRVGDAVLNLSVAMPEGLKDYDVRKLLEYVVVLDQLLDADPAARDEDREIELATMRAADVARRLRRRLVHEQLDDPQIAAKLVLSALDGIPVSDVAELLGVSTKTVRAWERGAVVHHNANRVVLVARLLSYLRSSMTARGVVMWFEAERDQLQGRTPRELIDEDVANAYPLLLDLARGSRGQLAG